MKLVLLDNAHFKRKRSHKIERSLNCNEWKSVLIDATCNLFQFYTVYRPVQIPSVYRCDRHILSLFNFASNAGTLFEKK